MSFLDRLSEAESKISNKLHLHDLVEHSPLIQKVENSPIISKFAHKLGIHPHSDANNESTGNTSNELPEVDLVDGCVTPPNWNDGSPAPRGRGKDQKDEHQHDNDQKVPDKEQKPSEQGQKPAEQSPKPIEQNQKAAEETQKPAEQSKKPAEETQRPAEQVQKPADESTKPAEQVQKPAEQIQKPAEQSQNPAERTPKPVDDTQKPREQSHKPAEQDNSHSERTPAQKEYIRLEKLERPESSSEAPKIERSKSDRDRFESAVTSMLPNMVESLPVRKGEGYYQVLSRMFPNIKESDLSALAHDAEKLNGTKILHTGDRFQILGEYGKKLLAERVMSDYDNKQEGTAEKKRERFSSGYEQVISRFAKSIGLSAEQATKITRREQPESSRIDQTAQRSENRPQQELMSVKVNHKDITDQKNNGDQEKTPDTNTDAHDSSSENIENPAKQKEVYESLKDFVAACAELKKQGEMLQFLGKWYTPDTNMYAYGMEKYADALEQVKSSAAELKASMKEQHERERLHAQWNDFVLKQQRSLAEFRRNLPILGDAYRQRFESHNLLETI